MSDELEEIRQRKLDELRNGERGQTGDEPAGDGPAEPIHVTGVEESQETVRDH